MGQSSHPQERRASPVILVLRFFLVLFVMNLVLVTGMTGLIYEVLWTRRLSLILGNSTHAVALILAAFMFGLALGSCTIGRIADRIRRPILVFGLLEAGVAGYMAVSGRLLGYVSDLYVSLGPATTTSYVVKFALAFLLLLIPSFLMGGSLPLVIRWATPRVSVVGGRVGAIYGANTLGAVYGSFLAGYFLLELLGVEGTCAQAVRWNLGAALLAVLAGIWLKTREPDPEPARAVEGPRIDPAGFQAAVGCFILSGFSAMALEVIWFRELVFFLQGFTWAFTAMLTTFLLGLALGALVLGFVVNRVRDPLRFLGWLLLGIGLTSVGAQILILNMFGIWKDIRSHVMGDWMWEYKFALFAGAACTMIVPTFLMGGVFPAVSRIAARRIDEVGRSIGWVYALNTVGAVLGSLTAGLVLIPLVGMKLSVAIVLIPLLLAASYVFWVSRRKWTPALGIAAAIGVAAIVVVLVAARTPFIEHSHVFKGPLGPSRKLLDYREGSICAVSVVEDEVTGFRTLYTDEFAAAATGDHYRYMRMLGHLPLMLAPERKDVLVIAFGTGTTAGSVAVHEGVERLDVVEISPEVLEVAHYFADVNKDVLTRPGPPEVTLHVMDGRNFVLTTDRRYDVVTLEPLMPYTPAAVNLYTKEFYEICARVLKPGGVMCQWIPIHAMSVDHYKMLARSFTDVFPDSSVWFFETTSAIIGRTEPGPVDHARLASRAREGPVAEDLRAIGLDDPEAVLSCFVTGGEDLRAFLADVEPMTDEHPTMEYHPVGYGALNSYFADNLGTFFQMRKPVTPYLALPASGADAIRRELAVRYERGQDFLAALNQEEVWKYLTNLKAHGRAVRHLEKAVRFYEQAIARAPGIRDPILEAYRDGARYRQYVFTALGHLNLGQKTEAIELLRRATALSPRDKPHQAFFLLGRTLMDQGEFPEAETRLARAVELFPRSEEYRETLEACRSRVEDVSDDAVARARVTIVAIMDGTAPRTALRDLRKARGRMPRLSDRLEPELRRVESRVHDPADAAGTVRERALKILLALEPEWLQETLAKFVEEERHAWTYRKLAAEAAARRAGHWHLFDRLRDGDENTRSMVAAALGRARARDATAALVGALEDEAQEVRMQAILALHAITGRQYDYDPSASAEKRAGSLRRWRDHLANPPD